MSTTRWMVAVGLAVVLPAVTFAQSDDGVPRTPWGHPDLQGIWTIAPRHRVNVRRTKGRRAF